MQVSDLRCAMALLAGASEHASHLVGIKCTFVIIIINVIKIFKNLYKNELMNKYENNDRFVFRRR